ncbi:MAG: carboxymuconolactone decarboxylase family protein [Halanaerobiales bacterium]|nr:carboxymuconolactone decarboxylase family protein [Halanaerobiales bacterium]
MNEILDKKTKELVALGASVAANCLPCFKYHYKQLKKLDVMNEEIEAAVKMASAVKKQPDKHMRELIEKMVGSE